MAMIAVSRSLASRESLLRMAPNMVFQAVAQHAVEVEELPVGPPGPDGLQQTRGTGAIVVGKIGNARLRHGLRGALRLLGLRLGANRERGSEDDEEDCEVASGAPWDHAPSTTTIAVFAQDCRSFFPSA